MLWVGHALMIYHRTAYDPPETAHDLPWDLAADRAPTVAMVDGLCRRLKVVALNLQQQKSQRLCSSREEEVCTNLPGGCPIPKAQSIAVHRDSHRGPSLHHSRPPHDHHGCQGPWLLVESASLARHM
eukprot:161920-Amphidinium_carterae.2